MIKQCNSAAVQLKHTGYISVNVISRSSFAVGFPEDAFGLVLWVGTGAG